MNELLQILAVMPAAFVMCLVLTGIHGYLGLHVLERKVIFVDLALAQIAALGGIYAMWLGYDPHHGEGHGVHTLRLFAAFGWEVPAPSDAVMVYGFSLAFALVGAGVFALTRMREERVPQEAFIGVAFATAVALALLILERIGGGSEHVRNMLARDALLFATWGDVLETALLYGAIGALHLVYRRRFFEITADADAARARGVPVRWWDFLFYATFGLVITSSVQIAGVLLVFSYLVVPGAVAVMFSERTGVRIAIAWAAGFVVSVVGMLACAADNVTPPGSPPGPWIVACFAAALVVAGVIRGRHNRNALRRVGLGALLVGALALVSFGFEKTEVHEDDHVHSDDPIREALQQGTADRLRALDEIGRRGEREYAPAVAAMLIDDPPPIVVERAAQVLGTLGDPAAEAALVRSAGRELDPLVKLELARALHRVGSRQAASVVEEVLASDLPPFDREDAAQLASEIAGAPVATE